MNYKLAKRLKDAGFPQKGKEAFVLSSDMEEKYRHIMNVSNPQGYTNLLAAGYDVVYKPTLEELIKACPKEKKGINHNKNDKGQEYGIETEHLFRLGWTGEDWFTGYDFHESTIEELISWGKTPKEAVAKLYLKLHTTK